MLKNIDEKILQKVELFKEGIIDFNDSFFNIKSVDVIQTYLDASEELDYYFQNAITLLLSDDIRFRDNYKIGCWFFSLINVLPFDDDYA